MDRNLTLKMSILFVGIPASEFHLTFHLCETTNMIYRKENIDEGRMTEEKDKTKTSNLLKRKQHVNIECSFIQLFFIVLLRLFVTVDSTHSQSKNNTGTIRDNEIQMLNSSVNSSKLEDQRIGIIGK